MSNDNKYCQEGIAKVSESTGEVYHIWTSDASWKDWFIRVYAMASLKRWDLLKVAFKGWWNRNTRIFR